MKTKMPYLKRKRAARINPRYYKRRRTVPPSSVSLRRRRGARYRGRNKTMRRIALNLAEAKDYCLELSVPTPMAHNKLYIWALHDKPGNTGITNLPIGAGADGGRQGREIYSVGFRVRGTFEVPYDRRNTRIKMWLMEWNSGQGTPTTLSEFFSEPIGGSSNVMLNNVNNERFPGVRKLRDLRVKSRDLLTNPTGGSGNTYTIYYDVWIPFKRKLTYATAATPSKCPTGGMKEYLSLIAGAYDVAGTLGTDNLITAAKCVCTFYFRDP